VNRNGTGSHAIEARLQAMAGMDPLGRHCIDGSERPLWGHEERFPPKRMSAGCGFRKKTIVGMRGNGRDAPIADLHAVAPEWEGSVLKRGLLGRLFACAARHDSD